MPTNAVLIQGFTAQTHSKLIGDHFGMPALKRAILAVAFVNERGVKLLEAKLASNAHLVTVFAGIRNDVTTRQGLARLHQLGVTLFTVDTAQPRRIFHPKLYLARSDIKAYIVVGSANLTGGGLNNNIEASAVLDLDLSDPGDRALCDTTEKSLDALAHKYPKNITKITSGDQLVEMFDMGRLEDEAVAKFPSSSQKKPNSPKDDVPAIALEVPALGASFTGQKPTVLAKSKAKNAIAQSFEPSWVPMWQSKPLKETHLNIPKSKVTNQKGGMHLGKGNWPGEDQRVYFRNVVFAELPWTKKKGSATVEETTAVFEAALRGVNIGLFTLRIAHSSAKGTHLENNAPTRLHWNDLLPHIRDKNLINATLVLCKDANDPKRFRLSID